MNFDLPYPPSVNHYWRMFRNRMIISREGREYRERIKRLCVPWLTGFYPEDKEISVELKVYPPDRRRRDLDNVLKAVLDAMQAGGVYADDSQISRLVVERKEMVKGGKLNVQLRSRAELKRLGE
jgi:crossover junction endodeoxyribonuclease RusA